LRTTRLNSFVHNRRFGLLFLLGLIGDLVVRAFIR